MYTHFKRQFEMFICLKEPALLPLRRPAILVEQTERALLRLVALARQILERLATRRLLAAAHNPAVLVLHKVGLLETAGCVLRRSVENLRLRANRDCIRHLILFTAILFSGLPTW